MKPYRHQLETWRDDVEAVLQAKLKEVAGLSLRSTKYTWDSEERAMAGAGGGQAEADLAEPELAVRAQRHLLEAMGYVLLAPGKRLRPILYLATRDLLGAHQVTEVDACFITAIEMIHNYSLVHDDLPAMDDDDYRRGRLSCHRAFDEATAILVGDALLNMAMEQLFLAVRIASEQMSSGPRNEGQYTQSQMAEDLVPGSVTTWSQVENALRAAGLMAERAGFRGMIGGQIIDLQAETAPIPGPEDPALSGARASLVELQLKKTAALLEAAILSAAQVSGVKDETYLALRTYARALGRAYQVQDDLLDLEGDDKVIGKTTGKDARAGKWTEVTLYGQVARGRLTEILSTCYEACDALEAQGYAPSFLRHLAEASAERTK